MYFFFRDHCGWNLNIKVAQAVTVSHLKKKKKYWNCEMGDEGVPLFTYSVSNQNRLQYSIGEKKKTN